MSVDYQKNRVRSSLFGGTWDSFEDTPNVSFTLFLTQTNLKIEGKHCSSMYRGHKIDCSLEDVSVSGSINGSIAIISFQSSYGLGKGDAKISLINNMLLWEITKPPKGEYYIPRKAFLKKRME